jgi:hypothetical protein
MVLSAFARAAAIRAAAARPSSETCGSGESASARIEFIRSAVCVAVSSPALVFIFLSGFIFL